MTDPTPEEMTTLARTMDWLMAREMAARAEAWDEGFKAGIDEGFIADNPYRDAPTEPIALATEEAS